MLTDEQIAVLDDVFRTGDVHAAVATHAAGMPQGDTPADRVARARYWQTLRVDPSAKEYLAFLREDALANGGVTLGEHTSALYADIRTAQDDMERLRRILSQTPGAPAALASITATVIKARELQAKSSGLYGKRESSALGDDAEDGAKVRGVRVEWV